jgi:cation transport protein ChaC
LPREQLLALVKGSSGRSGANTEYILNTVKHLRALGIRDHTLEGLAERLGG